MSNEEKLANEARRWGLTACFGVLDEYSRLPPSELPESSPVPAGLPSHLAAFAASPTGSVDDEGIRHILAWTGEHPIVRAAVARDLLMSRFVSYAGELRQYASALRLEATPFPRAIDLNDDAFWSELGDASAVWPADVLARAADWIDIFDQAHFPTCASLLAGTLARRGDAHALARWCDIAGDDSLRFPKQLEDAVPLTTFGDAADMLEPADLRLLQWSLRLRRAFTTKTVPEIRELLVAPLPKGGAEAELRALAVRVEARVRLGDPAAEMDVLITAATQRPTWRYGRWVGLLAFAAWSDLSTSDMLSMIDEHWRAFGGSAALYVEVARFAKDQAVFNGLVRRAIGDLLAHPQIGDLWIAVAMCLGSGDLAQRARQEVWAKLNAQLSGE